MVYVLATPINDRTRAMLAEVERLTGPRPDGLVVTQGRNPGGVAASAGTHDGWGVVDLRVRDWSAPVLNGVLLALRQVGFAAWHRLVSQGFDTEHIHAVAIGDPGMSPAARRQVSSYQAGRNGLANNGPDDGPGGYRSVTWELYQLAHQPKETDMPLTPADVQLFLDTKLRADGLTIRQALANGDFAGDQLAESGKLYAKVNGIAAELAAVKLKTDRLP